MRRRVAVALHDVEPHTLERSREVRTWLAELGIGRATLLVIPASRGNPIHPSSELAEWLRDRRRRGDVVAQHGLCHSRTRRARRPRRWLAAVQGGDAAEFAGLDPESTARALERGRGILRQAGVEPRGFVAPAYSYTRHLRRELSCSYEWWTDLLAVHAPGGSRYAPALCLGASTALKRATSPPLVRGLARIGASTPLGGSLLRIDLHPADLDHRRSVSALEQTLRRAQAHHPITYDELLDR